ncbi:MAG: hypothetical protein LAT75_08010 [Candidatus Cyclonatronum sp.]|uniref:hypothetical protein n=1 Tax=Cyclonatronum sp. TaxID=3024185 RepID=UPI0025BDC273|nr:hypothetical protein [Cyclonatronum sp.]MCH8486795.1 hypothetical protein [Cyclonatronum sp.]
MQQTQSMQAALSAFTAGLIDYAGLFPPAALDMAPAIENFLRYRSGPFAPQLGAFVVPAARLDELDGYAAGFQKQATAAGPVPFSVLAGGGTDAALYRNHFEAALHKAQTFLERHGAAVRISAFEVRLPEELPEPEPLRELLSENITQVRETLSCAPDFFFEPKRDGSWHSTVHRLVPALAAVQPSFGGALTGFKLRCGGVKAEMFPSVGEVACAIHACVQAGVPMKATAGLHHPVRHFNESVGTRMHGFLNVFGALALTKAHGWRISQTETMLADEQAASFRFTNEGFGYRDFSLSTAQLRQSRAILATSYGSCSFAEPLEDLHALGLLPARPEL